MKKLLTAVAIALLAIGLVLGQSEKKLQPWKLFDDDSSAARGRLLENRLWGADDPRTANPLNLYRSPADPPRKRAFEMRLPTSGTRPTYRFPTVRSLWEREDP